MTRHQKIIFSQHDALCEFELFCVSSSEMLGFLVCVTGFWILISVESTYSNSTNSSNFLDRKKRFSPRGYYAGVGFPYIPFAEPLTILAGLAFIAYIIQTYHAVYHHNHGLGGGLLSNVLPTKGRNLHPRPNRYRKQYVVQKLGTEIQLSRK